MNSEHLLSGSEMILKVRRGVLNGITITLAGRESGVTILLSDAQAKDLFTQLAPKVETELLSV